MEKLEALKGLYRGLEHEDEMVGYLPEIPPLYPDMIVEKFLLFCARLRGVAPALRAAA